MINAVVARHGSDVVARCNFFTRENAGRTATWLADHYAIMLFHTPFEAETVNGRETGKAGQMLINPPGRRVWLRGVAGQSFRSDWIHLQEDAVRKPIEQLNLPIDQIFSVSDTQFVARIIREFWQEQTLNAPLRYEMRACKATELLLLISRYSQMAQRIIASPGEHAHYERFCSIRHQLQEKCTHPWRVERMAAMANLGPTRFSELYKKFFDISPIEDVINMRLVQARWLLKQGAITVTEVAEACGFDNLNYFSRLFKARTGQSPREYRNGRPVSGQG